MATTKVTLTRTASIDDEVAHAHHRISDRAYELSCTSGAWNSPDQNWLNAERELLWQPAVDVCQKDGRFEVRAAVAGVEPRDLAVTVTPVDLLIKGNGAHERRQETGTVHVCEFSHGQLFRSIHFPVPIDPAKATADCRNGLLTITVPMAQAEVAKKPVVAQGRR